MASQFIGLPVRISLRSGPSDSATGILSSLDPQAGSILLSSCETTIQGVTTIEGIKVLRREDVVGLELLSTQRDSPQPTSAKPAGTRDGKDGVRRTPQLPIQQQQQQQQQQHALQSYYPSYSPVPSPSPLSNSPAPSTKPKSRNRQTRSRRAQDADEENEADLSTAYVERTASSSRGGGGGRRPQPQQQQQKQQQQPVGRRADAASFDEDFDFAAGVASFDKARVFEDIRIHDTIDPSLRLVAHNRNPSTLRDRSQTKLLPSESVLSSSELEAQQHERLAAVAARGVEAGGGSAGPSRAGSEGGEGGAGEESEGREREKVREKTRGKEREKLRRVKSGLRNVSLEGEGLITIEGVKIPTITSRQWREALSIAEIESSPTPAALLSYSSLLLSHYILSLSTAPHDLFSPPSPSSRPTLLILLTDCDKAVIALNAAVLLVNRGFGVTAVVEPAGGTGGGEGSEAYRTGLRVLSSAGGRIVKDFGDLAPWYSLILDALSSSSSLSSSPSLSASLSSLHQHHHAHSQHSHHPSPRPDLSSSQSFSASSSSHSHSHSFAPSSLAFAASAAHFSNSLPHTPRLSLDCPFGLDPDSASPSPCAQSSSDAQTAFEATFVLSFGLPRPVLQGLLAGGGGGRGEGGRGLAGAAVADVGIGKGVWKRVGVEAVGGEVFGSGGWVELRM